MTRVSVYCIILFAITSAVVARAVAETPECRPVNGGVTSSQSIDGYWLFRAPVDSVDILSGFSQPRRYGPNLGNGRDIGILWRPGTLDDEGFLLREEERYCGAWVQFFFDEPDIEVPAEIKNIYWHTWIFMEDGDLPIGEVLGVSVGENYNSSVYYDKIDFDQSLTWPLSAGYYNLTVYFSDNLDYTFQDLDELWGVSFKATGGNPQVLSYPSQKSFCIVNLTDSASLRLMDHDADGLNDYLELFTSFTDPYDADTDDDGHDDEQEFLNGKNGWDPFDWGTTHVFHPEGINNSAFLTVLNYQQVEPEPTWFTDTLSGEFTAQEYSRLTAYDHDFNSYPYYTDAEHPWSMVQVNLRYELPFEPNDILRIAAFWGGVWIGYDLVDGNADKVIEIMNVAGGSHERMLAKFGHTSVLYSKQVMGDPGDFVTPDGILSMRAYAKNRLSNSEIQLDFAEIWVTVGTSYIHLAEPVPDNPIQVTAGDTVTVELIYVEQDVEIVNGLAFDHATIGGLSCEIIGEAEFAEGHWRMDCVVPELAYGLFYDLVISASTSSDTLVEIAPEAVYVYNIDYICGDMDGDDAMPNISDLTYFVEYLFGGGSALPNLVASDVDESGEIDVSDLTYMVNYLFGGGPGPTCG